MPDKADVSIVPNPINPVMMNEVGGNNGVVYAPGPGMPGFDLSGQFAGLQDKIVSDVPEPGTMTLVALGMMGLLVVSRHKRLR